jgi:hypothetical protein
MQASLVAFSQIRGEEDAAMQSAIAGANAQRISF